MSWSDACKSAFTFFTHMNVYTMRNTKQPYTFIYLYIHIQNRIAPDISLSSILFESFHSLVYFFFSVVCRNLSMQKYRKKKLAWQNLVYGRMIEGRKRKREYTDFHRIRFFISFLSSIISVYFFSFWHWHINHQYSFLPQSRNVE